MGGVINPHHPDARVLTWGAGSGSGVAWLGRERCWGGRRGAVAVRRGPAGRGAAVPSRGGSSPSGTRPCGSWPSARPPARQSPWPDPAPRGVGEPSGSVPGDSGERVRGVRKYLLGPPPKTPGQDDGVLPTTTPASRYLAGQQAGADLLGVGVEHATLPVQVALLACGQRKAAGCRGGPGARAVLGGGTSALPPPPRRPTPVEVSTSVDGRMRVAAATGGHSLTTTAAGWPWWGGSAGVTPTYPSQGSRWRPPRPRSKRPQHPRSEQGGGGEQKSRESSSVGRGGHRLLAPPPFLRPPQGEPPLSPPAWVLLMTSLTVAQECPRAPWHLSDSHIWGGVQGGGLNPGSRSCRTPPPPFLRASWHRGQRP